MAVLQLVDRAELKRGKQGKAPKAEGEQAAAPVARDPLAGVRKMFAGKSRSSVRASEGKPAKAGKAPKAPKASARKASSGDK
jgi:hypothetical protein